MSAWKHLLVVLVVHVFVEIPGSLLAFEFSIALAATKSAMRQLAFNHCWWWELIRLLAVEILARTEENRKSVHILRRQRSLYVGCS